MRRNVLRPVVLALVCLLFRHVPLFAKPTRSLPHESSRRVVPVQTEARKKERSVGAAHAHSTGSPAGAMHGVSRPAIAGSTRRPAPVDAKYAKEQSHAVAHWVVRSGRGGETPARLVAVDHHATRQEQLNASRAAIAAADRHTANGDPLQTNRPLPRLRSEAEIQALATAPRRITLEPAGRKAQGVDAGDGVTVGQSQPRSLEQEAFTPVILPSLYDSRGRLVMPPALKGSREILLHQNQVADRDGLTRVQDDADLLGLRREKKLVPIPAGDELLVDERLPENRRFTRPWAAEFLARLARDHYAEFHTALQVNSAVRTVEFQQRLIRTNGNAAPADGDTASPHLTGQAIDIAKRGLTMPELAWMRAYLLPLVQQGKIDVEEEFQQSCFHVSVYKSYLPPSHLNVAAAHHAPADVASE